MAAFISAQKDHIYSPTADPFSYLLRWPRVSASDFFFFLIRSHFCCELSLALFKLPILPLNPELHLSHREHWLQMRSFLVFVLAQFLLLFMTIGVDFVPTISKQYFL